MRVCTVRPDRTWRIEMYGICGIWISGGTMLGQCRPHHQGVLSSGWRHHFSANLMRKTRSMTWGSGFFH